MISIRSIIVAGVAGVACVVSAVTPAGAQPARPAATDADTLFRRGRDLAAAGQLAEACTAFEQSHALEPRVTTLLNLAGCREKLGQLATARRLFLQAEEETRPESDEAMSQLRKVALERAAKLDPRVSKLTIHVADDRVIGGLEILRDGESVPAQMWNRELPVDGGTYAIAARIPGGEAWSTRVTIAAEADVRTVEVPDLRTLRRSIDAPAQPSGAVAPAKAVQPARPPVEDRRRGIGLPVGVGAGAVVLLGGALGFSLWGDSTYEAAKAETRDQARRDSLERAAERRRYVAEGLAAAGVGCAGVAAWLYLRHRGGRAEPSPARTRRVTLAPGASGIGVAGWF